MIACIIEFGIRKGMETRHRALLEPMLREVESIAGFVSKETFESLAQPGRLVTISYWESREAMKAWMANANHRQTMLVGKREVFTHYAIRIAEIERAYEWTARA